MTYMDYPVVHGRSAPTNSDSSPPHQRSLTQPAGGHPQADRPPQGQSVSTSEIAKQLLEPARGDRFETVELLSKPMEAVLEIRRKGEAGHMLSRAQWTVLASGQQG